MKDGAYVPARACSYEHDELNDVLACMRSQVDVATLRAIEPALRAAEQRMRSRWPELERHLQRVGRDLSDQLASPEVEELLGELIEAAKLTDETRLVFKVVLVAKPAGDISSATHEGPYLVVEIDENTEAKAKLEIVLHELAHLATQYAPDRAELERVWGSLGLEGVIAGNLWEEAFATAYGNGLAAATVSPRGLPSASPMYNDAAVAALGRGLFERWHAGNTPHLDASFARLMLDVARDCWPQSRWRWRDLL